MFLGAILYTTVGHAGASAYIAIMALFSVPTLVIRPTALVLNIFVSIFVSLRFVRAGFFRLRVLAPILIGAVPMAFIGGYIQLPPSIYRPLVGVVLIVAAIRLMLSRDIKSETEIKDPPIFYGVASGAAIGLLSGLTGTGGGIFLSPLILFLGWSDTKTASGVAAVFILFNSIAGLLGNLTSVRSLPPDLPLLVAVTLLGAFVGTYLGIKHLNTPAIQKTLGIVLLIAGVKMLGVY
mgnify:CR=1 FL=1